MKTLKNPIVYTATSCIPQRVEKSLYSMGDLIMESKEIWKDVVGYERFINEIVWCYTGAGIKSQKNYSRKHDNIYLYSKTQNYTF